MSRKDQILLEAAYDQIRGAKFTVGDKIEYPSLSKSFVEVVQVLPNGYLVKTLDQNATPHPIGHQFVIPFQTIANDLIYQNQHKLKETSQTPKEYRTWEDSKNWIDHKQASRFIPDDILDTIPLSAKILIVPGDEIADCIMYNDFKGGIHVFINREWKWFKDENEAFQGFLEQDHWAS